MAATVLNISEIMSDPNIYGGRPVIVGTTVKVSDVALRRTTGDRLLPPQIAEIYRLSLGQVHAALAYYYLHQDEIDEEIRRSTEEANPLR